MLITDSQRRVRLARRHHLAVAAPTVEAATAGVIGLHSSDPASVFLAAAARVKGFTNDRLEDALYERRSLVRMLGMRRTMFVVDRETAAVMDAACTQALAPGERRRLIGLIESQGIATDGAGWLRAVEKRTLAALVELGAGTATQLTPLVPELRLKLKMGEGKKWGADVGMSTRVLFLLATEGRIVRARPLGTWISSQYRWAPTETWIGDLPELEPAEARVTLLQRWLFAFGPGTLRDITWWTGWTQRAAKTALASLDAVTVTLTDGDTGYLLPDDTATLRGTRSWVALLPGLDPTVMGWKDRDWYLGPHASDLFDRNGNAGPTVWSDGRVVGGWAQQPDGHVVVGFLEPVPTSVETAVRRAARDLDARLHGTVVTPRFRTPLERRLVT